MHVTCDQACLHLSDRTLAAVRAGMFTTRDNFQAGALAMLSEDVMMEVPGLGIYYGREDALEYGNIMADSVMNEGYHVFLQSMVRMNATGNDTVITAHSNG